MPSLTTVCRYNFKLGYQKDNNAAAHAELKKKIERCGNCRRRNLTKMSLEC